MKYDYDVIIIGAGIGGLVCGCFLAKAGMKTLIVEKNSYPGGYCCSFKRKGFLFDACVHSLGSLREGGHLNAALKDLDILQQIDMHRQDPSDIIYAPDFKVAFWHNLERTIEEFQEKFPMESASISRFFNFLADNKKSFNMLELGKKSFSELLGHYFDDHQLKAILALPVLGNAGLPPSQVSSFTAVALYREFMLDGGYYPQGGIQAFPNVLLDRFNKSGGEAIFSRFVTKICHRNGIAEGILLSDKSYYTSKYVVSNADAVFTFSHLLSDNAEHEPDAKLRGMSPSLSMFILYAGTDGKVTDVAPGVNNWFLPGYDVEKMYSMAVRNELDNLDWFLARLSIDKKTVMALVNMPYMDEQFWKENKQRVRDQFKKKVERLIPGLATHAVYVDAATPLTLQRWTRNFNGSAYGWAGTVSQFGAHFAIPPVKNLFLTGHWSTVIQGIPGVTYHGRKTAESIVKRQLQ